MSGKLNVGFYHHLGTVLPDGRVAAPAHMATFVSELARQAGMVTYYGHQGERSSIDDTVLEPSLVRSVSLGPRRRAPVRALMSRWILRRFRPEDDGIDVLLVRAPTPLLPALLRSAPSSAVLLGGDYSQWRPSMVQPRWRNALITLWVRIYLWLQRRAVRGVPVMANSPHLVELAQGWGARATEVFTSSLSQGDLDQLSGHPPEAWDADVGRQRPLRVMYAGRISEEKGLVEAIEAVARLSEQGWKVELDLVGAADDERFADYLRRKAAGAGVADRVVFGGYIGARAELLQRYASAHVFVIPSRTDGFPRALTEALAVGVPVVASRVGGIARRMTDEETALLVEPGSAGELAGAIERLASDGELRARLVEKGSAWARSYTNERSCQLILAGLREVVTASDQMPVR